MNNRQILIIDDEPDIREILQFNIENEGFITGLAASAEEAEKIMAEHPFDLLLLDVMMGGMSGFQFARKLREQGNETPVIFLTAKDTENDLLTGFSLGADDFIRKPFSIKEVIARIKSVLNRSKSVIKKETEDIYQFENLKIDFERKTVETDSKNVVLTKKEFEILTLLVKNRGKIFTREDILNKVWNDSVVIDRTVDVHITRLRRKLDSYGELLINRSGYGYTFTENR
ncbi:MAG: response regulator transcription factor [Prevotellaceae bacterium]|nr:response regulator transcription factor [Prevotellaceae bacterium]